MLNNLLSAPPSTVPKPIPRWLKPGEGDSRFKPIAVEAFAAYSSEAVSLELDQFPMPPQSVGALGSRE